MHCIIEIALLQEKLQLTLERLETSAKELQGAKQALKATAQKQKAQKEENHRLKSLIRGQILQAECHDEVSALVALH